MSDTREEWRNVYDGNDHTIQLVLDCRGDADRFADPQHRTGLQRRTITTSEWADVPLVDPKPGDCVRLRNRETTYMYIGDFQRERNVTPRGSMEMVAWIDPGCWYVYHYFFDPEDIAEIVPHPQTGELR